MLIFFRQRLTILSVPKTGSTAMQTALGPSADLVISDPPALKHAPVYRYNRFIRPMYEKVCGVELDLMAVMREPVSWLGSWYRYRQREDLAGKPNSTQDISFDDFVRAYCEDMPPAFADVGSQEKFLAPQANGCRVSHLFAYEDQEGIAEFLTRRLGPLPGFGRENVSPPAQLALSADAERRLREVHAATFALYHSIRRHRER